MVVIPEATAQLLVVHLWLVLALTPALRHLQDHKAQSSQIRGTARASEELSLLPPSTLHTRRFRKVLPNPQQW